MGLNEKAICAAVDAWLAVPGHRLTAGTFGGGDGAAEDCRCPLACLAGTTEHVVHVLASQRGIAHAEELWAFVEGFDGIDAAYSARNRAAHEMGRRLRHKYAAMTIAESDEGDAVE